MPCFLCPMPTIGHALGAQFHALWACFTPGAHSGKNDRKRYKTVGVEVIDISETPATIEETEVSDNSNNNAIIVAYLVDHPNHVEKLLFKPSFHI